MGQSASQDQNTKIKNSISTRMKNDSNFRNTVINNVQSRMTDSQLTESITNCGGNINQNVGQNVDISGISGAGTKVTVDLIENIAKTNPITLSCAAEITASPQQKLDYITYMQQSGQINQTTANQLANSVNQSASQGATTSQGMLGGLTTGTGLGGLSSLTTMLPIIAVIVVVIIIIMMLT